MNEAVAQAQLAKVKLPYTQTFLDVLSRIPSWILRRLPEDFSHTLALSTLKYGGAKILEGYSCPLLPSFDVSCQLSEKISLKHPVGMAAGFDKNGEIIPALRSLGFSFAEVGTTTPRPQAGNPGKKLFRIPGQRGLVNRCGFNNCGAAQTLKNICDDRTKPSSEIPIGVNLGKNKDTPLEKALEDYLFLADTFQGIADYLVVNISSPNTPGLRKLASTDFIRLLAQELGSILPDQLGRVWIKLDPDLPKPLFQKLIATMSQHQFAGVILANTQQTTTPVKGGMSGHPLAICSSSRLEWAYEVHRGDLTMIGVGGILSGRDIYEKIIRGAAAVQIYTALVYRGPLVVANLLNELYSIMAQLGVTHLSDLRYSYYHHTKQGNLL
ncbi:MAG: quinone-dependent dihydroorotate dehydrogenase [Zetaproteobacteria bacterium]|nr:quinone-dependent dihydroorotate dehydrogenase [Zetaproteobacteria bacterium]